MPESVYLIGSEEARSVKIGYTIDVVKRLASLQTGSSTRLLLLAVLPGGRVEERLIHKELKRFRCNGEWFDFGDADPAQIFTAAWQKAISQLNVVVDAIREIVEAEEVGPTSCWEIEDYSPLRDVLVETQRCFIESGESFLSLSDLHGRLMALDGLHWWKYEKATEWSIQSHLKAWVGDPIDGGYYRTSFEV